MRITTTAILAVSLAVSNALPTHACSCDLKTHRRDLRNAKAVFIGRVIEIKSDVQIPVKLEREV